MRRRCFYPLLLALLVSAPAAQASVISELSQSFLSGPSTELLADYARSLPVSEPAYDTDPSAMPNPMAASPGADRNSPSFFLMPVGRPDEVGIGLGIRFPF